MNLDNSWWLMEKEEDSAIKRLEKIRISDSFDSTEIEDVICRGNPIRAKTKIDGIRKTAHRRKVETSSSVMSVLNDQESSGYNSSISPTTSIATSVQFPISQGRKQRKGSEKTTTPPCTNSIKMAIINMLKTRSTNKDICHNSRNNFILEFGDTRLIMSCRRGQLLEVQEALKELGEHKQLDLIDHRNMANETALSVAMYTRKERIITLLVKHGASPCVRCTMGNNVLHLAASMTDDVERKTLKYLLDVIQKYQPKSLLPAVMNRNMFNYDVSEILNMCQENLIISNVEIQSIQSHIKTIDDILDSVTDGIF